MSELDDVDLSVIAFQSDGEIYQTEVNVISHPNISAHNDNEVEETYGVGPIGSNLPKRISKEVLSQTRKLIRTYTLVTMSSFKNLGAVEVSEVTLKFDIGIDFSQSIPFIAEGKAKSNLAIEVKCKFPDQKSVDDK